MNYYRSQIDRLPADADHYALQIDARNYDDEKVAATTKWLTLNKSQLDRIADILAEGDIDDFYVVGPNDVNKPMIKAFGKTWAVDQHFGRLQRRDIGKRIVKVTNNAGDYDFLQIESDQQFNRRNAL